MANTKECMANDLKFRLRSIENFSIFVIAERHLLCAYSCAGTQVLTHAQAYAGTGAHTHSTTPIQKFVKQLVETQGIFQQMTQLYNVYALVARTSQRVKYARSYTEVQDQHCIHNTPPATNSGR